MISKDRSRNLWDYSIQWESPDADMVSLIYTNEAARRAAAGLLIGRSQTVPEEHAEQPAGVESGLEVDYLKQQFFAWIGQQLASLQPVNLCCDAQQRIASLAAQGGQYLHNLSTVFTNSSGDPTALDVNAPITNFDSSSGDDSPTIALRDIALCNACQEMVDQLCDTEISNRDPTNLNYGILIGTILLTALLPEAAIVAVVFSIFAGGANAGFHQVSETVLKDKIMRHGAGCCMYEALKGQGLSRNTFIGSMQGCSTWESTDISPLTGAIAPMLQAPGFYEMFLKALGVGYRQAQLDLLTDCGCDASCSTFDHTDGDWDVTAGTVDNPTDSISADDTAGVVIEYDIPGGGLHKVTSVNWVDSDTAFNVQNVYVDCYDGATLVFHQQMLTSYHNSAWSEINEPPVPFIPVDAVDKIVIGNTFDVQDGVFTMHAITVCWE
jgi:hypothetical protein